MISKIFLKYGHHLDCWRSPQVSAALQVPLKRVNQAYVIATSTKVSVDGADVSKFDDAYFKPTEKKVKKKGEKEFFEEEETSAKVNICCTHNVSLICINFFCSVSYLVCLDLWVPQMPAWDWLKPAAYNGQWHPQEQDEYNIDWDKNNGKPYFATSGVPLARCRLYVILVSGAIKTVPFT